MLIAAGAFLLVLLIDPRVVLWLLGLLVLGRLIWIPLRGLFTMLGWTSATLFGRWR
jgi:hypothetical protein